MPRHVVNNRSLQYGNKVWFFMAMTTKRNYDWLCFSFLSRLSVFLSRSNSCQESSFSRHISSPLC